MCVVARTPTILTINNVFWQYCGNITKTGFVDSFGSIAAILPERVIAAILPETNLHVKSVLQQYCQTMLQRYCCSRLPEALYFGKGKPFCFTILLKVWLGN